jgi:MFS family permease
MQAGTVSRPFGALFIMIFMPFALGYVVQQFFRSINAVIASRLVTDLNLDAAQLGLLTSMFFLGASAAQLPVGALIDRLGPGRTQAMLLVLATAGAALFSIASDPQTAMLGRLLIGIGVAATLPTGMKAIVLWFPKARVGLLNGLFIAIGTLGAIATSVPAEWVLASYSWRDIFVWMAIASAAMSCLMMFAIPRAPQSAQAPASVASGFRQIITDRRFWRVAPTSSLVVASAWSLSLLWVSPWLRDVDGASQLDISAQLLVLTVAQCLGALGLGIVVDRLRGRGIGPDRVLMGIAGLLITGEMAIYFAWAPGRALAWTAIGIVCATNVVSFTVTAELFEKEILGRANGALNLLHLSTTFAVQALFGVVIALWPRDAAGHYPPEA